MYFIIVKPFFIAFADAVLITSEAAALYRASFCFLQMILTVRFSVFPLGTLLHTWIDVPISHLPLYSARIFI